MTSSGARSFTITNGEVVIAAYERCQIFMPQLEQKHFYSARRELNLLLGKFSNLQPNLWEVTLRSQTLTQGTATYTLSSDIVMILDAYRSINQGQTNQTDIFMTSISRDDYAAYPVKQTQGPPTQYWFNRQIVPTITTYPVADGGGPYTLNYYAVLQMQDANIPSGETPDVPYRWYDALVAGLAYSVSRIYAPALESIRKTDAQDAWNIAATQDTENAPVRIQPKFAGYFR